MALDVADCDIKSSGAPEFANILDEPVDDYFNPREMGRRGPRGSGAGIGSGRNPNDMGQGGGPNRPDLGTGGAPGFDSMQGPLNRLSGLTHGKVGPGVDPPPFQTIASVYFIPPEQ